MIGVFDSGLGGLAVLAEIEERLPDHSFVYLADQHNSPYGDRNDVMSLTMAAIGLLVDRFDVDTIVLACNTASAAALDAARDLRPDITFVGMEPAVKPAAAISKTGIIGVMATTGTVTAQRLDNVINRHASSTKVIRQACPGLVEIVEDGLVEAAAPLVEEYVRPILAGGADVIVLGCTHYTFLTDIISRIAGPEVTIVDPAPAIATQVARVAPGLSEPAQPTQYLTTGDPHRLHLQLKEMLSVDAPVLQVSTAGP